MNKTTATILLLAMSTASTVAWAVDYCDNEVRSVTPGNASGDMLTPPSDAIVLFDGRDLSHWKGKTGPAQWDVHNGVLTVKKGTGDIESKQLFRDIQLHLEWLIPTDISGEGQRRGNSGVFLEGRYEIQIVDSYSNRTYADGQAGSVYGQARPLVNAMRKPGEWNVFDVLYTAPRFNDDGTLFTPGRVTVLHNGILVQNNTEILGDTGPLGRPGYEPHSSGPIRLQDHPDPSKPISYRNIWVRELGNAPAHATADDTPVKPEQLAIVSKLTLKQLLEDPARREVLARCLPELVPNAATTTYMNDRTLPQLKAIIVSLTDAKLNMINAELARVP